MDFPQEDGVGVTGWVLLGDLISDICSQAGHIQPYPIIGCFDVFDLCFGGVLFACFPVWLLGFCGFSGFCDFCLLGLLAS